MKTSIPEASRLPASSGIAEFVADIIVVGGGGSGLAAAIEATDLGRTAILLEKNAKLGGSTTRSIGSFAATGTPHQLRKGIQDNPEDHFVDLGIINEAYCKAAFPNDVNEDNLDLRRILIYNANDTLCWLMSMGIRFYGPTLEKPHRKPRMHNVLPNSHAYGYWLERRARSIGVDIRVQRRASRLLFDGPRVTGIECLTEQGTRERYRARRGVVLACGDYSGSTEMKRRYAPEALANMPTSCEPANTGDGHLMVIENGGRIRNPHMVYGKVRFVAPPIKWIQRLPPWPLLTAFMAWSLDHMPPRLLRPFIMSFLTTVLEAQPSLYKHGAILVNKRGARFCDEMKQPERKLVDEPDQRAWIVFDDRLAKKYSAFPHFVSTAPGVAYAYVPDYERSRKDIFHKAPTLEALARAIGADPLVFAQAVADSNRTLAADVAASSKTGETPSIEHGPFYAMGPVSCFVKGSDGGVAIDTEFRILGANDQPIPGLFGAGLVGQGGVLLEGHGQHLSWAFTSGRLAGRNAAHLATTADVHPGKADSATRS